MWKKLALLILISLPCVSQNVYAPMLLPHQFFVDVNTGGTPCAGCSLYSYAAGTTTPLATYTDSTGVTPQTNPVILDASGSAGIWVAPVPYRFVLEDPLGATLWTADNVIGGGEGLPSGCNSPGAGWLNCANELSVAQPIVGNAFTIEPLTSIAAPWTLNVASPGLACTSMDCYDGTFEGNYATNGFQPEMQMLSDGCSPVTEWSVLQGAGGSVAPITGCIAVPSSSIAQQASGLAGMANTSSATTFAVGVYGQGRALVNNSEAWGFNSVAADVLGKTGVTLHGYEPDVNVLNTTTTVHGVDLQGSWGAQPTNAVGFEVGAPLTGGTSPPTHGVYYYNDGFQIDAAATSGTGIYIEPAIDCLQAGTSCPSGTTSQAIEQISWAASAANTWNVSTNVDNLGDYTMSFFTGASLNRTMTIPANSATTWALQNPVSSPYLQVAGSSGGGGLSVDASTGALALNLNNNGYEWRNQPLTSILGTIDSTGDLSMLGSLTTTPVAVGSLPAASSANAGQWRTVSDSTTISAEGQTCAGGNSTPPNKAAAFSNGSIWKCF